MSFNLDSKEVEFAVETVRQSSLLVDAVRREMAASTLTKNDRSPVTVADFASQAIAGYRLSEIYPNDSLVGEESSAPLKNPEAQATLEKITTYVKRFIPQANSQNVCDWIDRGQGETGKKFWVMDPIDGTKGFLRGDQYAVALALVVDGDVKIGVLGCPNLSEAKNPDTNGLGSIILGVRGKGSWWIPLKEKGSWRPVCVTKTKLMEEAVLLRSLEASHTDSPKMNKFIELSGIKQPARLMDSLAKYGVLAAGGADLLVRMRSGCSSEQGEYIWDQAAGTVIVEEAGGRVTDLDGKKLDYTTGKTLNRNRGVLLSNGYLHETALKALKQISEKELL